MAVDTTAKAGLHKNYQHWVPDAPLNEDWDKELTFVLIRSLDELRVHDVEHRMVAWDTETSGFNPDTDWIVGFSFSFDGKTGYYVPVKHDDIALGKEALDIFHSILKKAAIQFLYNCRFDQRFMEAAGYSLDGLPYYDAMNAIWLADTNVVMPSLKGVERKYLGWTPKTFSETLGEATTFQHVPAEDAYAYACVDAIGTYQIALCSNKYYKESLPASRYDNEALYPLMRLENTPQRLDLAYLKSMRETVVSTIERTRAKVYELAGREFNLNSPAQFGKVLVEVFGVDTGIRTSTGAMKADLKTVDAWLVKMGGRAGREVRDFLAAYKEFKKTVKFQSSYLEKYIKAAEESDVFPIRFSYKMQSVPTGRVSCGGDLKNKFFTANNVQSTPKPHAIMLKGRRATEAEMNESLDILGWYFSNDIPDGEEEGYVEGMDPDNLNIRRAFLPENDQCYVVSIDMCLEGGSPVQTKRGYMGICEMKPGDEVWSPQGWVTVERVMRTGVEKVVKVFPDNGGQAIYCTENHPFVINGEKVKAKDIKGTVPSVPFPAYVKEIDDRTKTIDKLSCLYCCTTLKEASVIASEQGLKPVIEEALGKYTRAEVAKWCGIRVSSFGHFMNDLGIQPTGKSFRYSQSKFYNNVFAGESTPTSAYLFGFILGDGNISRRRGDYLTLNISSKDEAHLRQICNIFGADLNIRHNEKKGCEWWCLDIPSREICNRMLSLGIAERKSTEPSNIDFEWLGDNFRHFIRGLFDADGYVRITTVLDISFVGHDSYIAEIKKRIEGQWGYKRTPSLSHLSLHGTIEQKKFIYEYLYQEATIWLQRKRDIIESWYQDKFGDLVFPVWNCTVGTNEHQYYTNGVTTKNCAEELRVVANIYGEKTWCDAFNNGVDVHRATAIRLFGEENYSKDARKKAKCLSGRTKVLTEHGAVFIRDLVPASNCYEIGVPVPLKRHVRISTPEGMSDVTHWIYNGVQDTLRIRIEYSLTLEVTPDHLVGMYDDTVQSADLCSRYRLVRADSLKVGDRLLWDYAPMRVTSIEHGRTDVYDITVNNVSHTFHANGIVVHNCASFGILYGSGAQGFNQNFPDMTLDECRDFLKKFKEALPRISEGQNESVAYARIHGTINTGYGRQRRVRFWLESSDRAKVAFGERTVKNSIVQGTAADVLKIILCRLWKHVFKPYPQVKFMSTIHDEVNFSIPIELAREVIPICMKCMTIERDDWPVTLKCSLSISRTDLGSLVPFTYDRDTDTYTPDWEAADTKAKHKTEPKPDEAEQDESADETDDGMYGMDEELCML